MKNAQLSLGCAIAVRKVHNYYMYGKSGSAYTVTTSTQYTLYG